MRNASSSVDLPVLLSPISTVSPDSGTSTPATERKPATEKEVIRGMAPRLYHGLTRARWPRAGVQGSDGCGKLPAMMPDAEATS